MALFGRRKPGFAKEETVRPSEIPGEFSDALDPAMQQGDENPKHREKTEAAARADAVLGAAAEPAGEAPKQDLLEYMESLPEVPDPFPPMAEEPEPEPEPELTSAQKLAHYISLRTGGAQLTSRKDLLAEVEDAEAVLAAMEADETCAYIAKIEGEKDVYYYDSEQMTRNYAMIAMYVADRDVPRTIAEMVRWNCKTYPSPTPLDYFQRHPYYLTQEQLDQALQAMAQDERYQDIHVFLSGRGVRYLYSEREMSDRYAKALAQFAEEEENSNA